ncbi:5-(carboxyamino)imidazole ribonucleotide synthase [Carbonactinospora thermoautotrophica]|uniref:N5-carboxyaminoimidazole ribonucleotide synthase n=1 Tax=Carbonactinospora thermoautotrophica TaxID=1469144 RepID=A0A132MYH5_9ACTN|nr:5-(carboxyamino)imidazole ribonucleotide synthase [Carbonactinospora thermoautotrophica]KWX02412.1 phosphoribosylaminoimidazole carboxylase [Carbonactinospora thermoautotrophica]MCX9190292.1 5-(carboxyamino)imidazole ribonucleotide synthase [Carbonactinospora thermoautotrophica]
MKYPVVGMVGGGQLARMTHQASIGLGITFRVLAQTPDDSAAQVARHVHLGDHRDLDALRAFAAECDVVTFDHEHVPAAHLRALRAEGVVVRPGPDALVHAQDKGLMRERLTRAGVPCPRWRHVATAGDVAAFAEEVGWPVVLKARRGGYDGKGVWVVPSSEEARRLVEEATARKIRLIAEEKVEFTRELAALVARSPHGQGVAYPVVETVQVDGVCREVIAPAPGLDPEHAAAAQQAALKIAGELDVTGVLAVELFDTPAGVLVNELAMRPHNSGHWTIEGARTSQFEQHLRAVLDLPLGDPSLTAPYVVMANVLGLDEPDIYGGYEHCMARDPGLKIHMYGKEVRPGRKIGHVTVLGDDLEDVRERARHAAAYLRGEIT